MPQSHLPIFYGIGLTQTDTSRKYVCFLKAAPFPVTGTNQWCNQAVEN